MASTTRQLARRASLVLANFRTRRLIVFAESPSPIGCLCLRRRFSRRTIVSFVASAYARNTRSSAFGARTCTSPGTTTRVTRVTARESSLGSATRRALASKTLNVSLSSRRGFVAYARFTACVPSIIVAKTSARTSAGAGRRNLRDMARRGVSRRRRIGADSTLRLGEPVLDRRGRQHHDTIVVFGVRQHQTYVPGQGFDGITNFTATNTDADVADAQSSGAAIAKRLQ
mmetsp:Transcript_4072/g.15709  ORF Transcript_4072/g.15709 Transcript_4072/m.15709 type:complete len:229 (-) Transcript_4072:2715-3401(-)